MTRLAQVLLVFIIWIFYFIWKEEDGEERITRRQSDKTKRT